MTPKIAIVGATGAVGRRMIDEFAKSRLSSFPLGLFASPRSAGLTINFGKATKPVEVFSLEALKPYSHILMSAGGSFSKEFSPQLVKQGAVVIDNSSAWRMDAATALCVPEVNGQVAISSQPRVIANPNCSTIQLVMALHPLRQAFGLKKVIVASYQSVSGTGQKGIEELDAQISALNGLKASEAWSKAKASIYAKPISCNVLPAIDRLDSQGHCFEEEKVVRETQKILEMPELDVFAHTARVPTFFCHAEAVTVQLGRSVTLTELQGAFQGQPGIHFTPGTDYESLPTSIEAFDDSRVFVSRARIKFGHQTSDWAQFWNVSDNLRKGAASNAVQILDKILS